MPQGVYIMGVIAEMIYKKGILCRTRLITKVLLGGKTTFASKGALIVNS